MAKSTCGLVLSSARKRYGNSKEGKSKAMKAYQNCRKKSPKKAKAEGKRRRRRSKMFGLF